MHKMLFHLHFLILNLILNSRYKRNILCRQIRLKLYQNPDKVQHDHDDDSDKGIPVSVIEF
jgi:hypothetical protein